MSGYLRDLNADAEVALQKICTQRGWRSQRLGSDLYLFEDLSETLVRVDNDLLSPLLRSDSSASLREALTHGVTAGPRRELPTDLCDCRRGYLVALDLLGVRVDVVCEHEACADGVRSYYSALHQPAPAASAEVVVRCNWPVADRYLFRARESTAEGTPLEGVTVMTLGAEPRPWTSVHQPLPPLVVWPFRDRFTALHAAAIRTERGRGVLLAGERQAGKTTAALAMANNNGAWLLADETAFVHCRTTVVEAFPHAVGMWAGGRKARVPITDVCRSVRLGSVEVSQVIFLFRRAGPVEVRRLERDQVLRNLLPHHRHGGASAGDAMATLLRLASVVDGWTVSYEDHRSLGPAVAEVCEAGM